MRRILILFLVLFIPLGGATTTYHIQTSDGPATVNVSFDLTSQNQVNYWETQWALPADASIESLSDTQGPITEYDRVGNQLMFETNRGPRRSRELVTLVYTIPDAVAERYKDVSLYRFRLSGVTGEPTQVQVETGQELLAETHSFGYDYSMARHGANYTGTGPINLHLSVSDTGERYDNFVLFGDGNLTEADDLYAVAPAITGFRPETNRYPVIVYPDKVYDQRIDTWSAGQYRSGGLIFIREPVLEQEPGAAIILHEVMHAFNEHALRWATGYERPWFDEGTAKYVEFLIKEKKGLRQPEIFGDRVEWRCERYRTCYYDPRGTPDQLWQYYENEKTFMAEWSPQTAGSTTVRTFGYAFSELLIRRYIQEHGADALHPVYQDLNTIQEPVTDPGQATDRILTLLDSDFRPCYSPVKAEFEQCLDDINTMTPGIPNTTVQGESQRITITPIDRPDPGTTFSPQYTDAKRRGLAIMEAVTQLLRELLTEARTTLQHLLTTQ